MEYKMLYLGMAALIIFVVLYKRYLHRDDDKPHKPLVILISGLMLAGIYNTNRPFLDKHGSDILSIVVCLLTALVFMDVYESVAENAPLKQVFRVESSGTVTTEEQ